MWHKWHKFNGNIMRMFINKLQIQIYINKRYVCVWVSHVRISREQSVFMIYIDRSISYDVLTGTLTLKHQHNSLFCNHFNTIHVQHQHDECCYITWQICEWILCLNKSNNGLYTNTANIPFSTILLYFLQIVLCKRLNYKL